MFNVFNVFSELNVFNELNVLNEFNEFNDGLPPKHSSNRFIRYMDLLYGSALYNP